MRGARSVAFFQAKDCALEPLQNIGNKGIRARSKRCTKGQLPATLARTYDDISWNTGLQPNLHELRKALHALTGPNALRLLGQAHMKILIVDDHPLFRAGFHAVLEQSDLEAAVLSVSSVAEALQILKRDGDVGLVLLDIHLRGEDGFNALKLIGEKFPTTACIMISGDEHEGVAPRVIAAGASGFIPKSFTADEMIAAIRQVLNGDVFVPSQAQHTTPPSDGTSLTLRQLEVISMLGRGFSNKEIARALDVAERTVKAHVSAVFEALNVRNRTQAVLVAQRRGFLPASSGYAAASQ
jgi:two-component system, NarL family, nitrate/nitrite response regulator NarL